MSISQSLIWRRRGDSNTQTRKGGSFRNYWITVILRLRVNLVPPAGVEPTTPGLGNLCSIQLSYEGITLIDGNQILSIIWWTGMVSNHRRRKPMDLQSIPFNHSGTDPLNVNINMDIVKTKFRVGHVESFQFLMYPVRSSLVSSFNKFLNLKFSHLERDKVIDHHTGFYPFSCIFQGTL